MYIKSSYIISEENEENISLESKNMAEGGGR
jgi:hypothetical protein